MKGKENGGKKATKFIPYQRERDLPYLPLVARPAPPFGGSVTRVEGLVD